MREERRGRQRKIEQNSATHPPYCNITVTKKKEMKDISGDEQNIRGVESKGEYERGEQMPWLSAKNEKMNE